MEPIKVKSNLQVVLDSDPDIKEWFEDIVNKGRKYNLSLIMLGDELLKLTKDDHTETIRLDEGLEQLKLDLLSLKVKYPITL